MQAVRLVKQSNWSIRKVARFYGVQPSTILRWTRKDVSGGWYPIATKSSRPKYHPNSLRKELVEAIVAKRKEKGRCAAHLYRELKRQNISVSESSVKRTLDRQGLLKKRSPWKRPHDYTPRPEAKNPGDLMQIDTVQTRDAFGNRIYLYTIIDLCSRWAYAKVVDRISANGSGLFVREATKRAPFQFSMVQSDHGSEFSIGFTHQLLAMNILHRHSRVRQSNDNAHIERFNRTIQEECLDRVPFGFRWYKKALPQYLKYYNSARIHMGINYQTPAEVLRSY